jgi:hypothetical protein
MWLPTHRADHRLRHEMVESLSVVRSLETLVRTERYAFAQETDSLGLVKFFRKKT